MAYALDIMKGGVPAGVAKAINGTNNAAVSPGTTQTQAGATALTASINAITTVATARDGVRLVDGEIGDEVEIANFSATNALMVYPPTGAQINAVGTNNGFLLAPNTAVKLRKFSATRWMAFLSA